MKTNKTEDKNLDGVEQLDKKIALLVTVIPAIGTLLAIALCFLGYPPSVVEISVACAFYIATGVGLEVGFHRLVTHKAFKASPLLKKTLIAFGSMGVHGPVIWWSAIHRNHHVTSDGPEDPHSPHQSGEGFGGTMKGIYHSHMGWLFVANSTRPENWQRHVKDLYKDPLIFHAHMHYFRWVVIGLVLPAIICGLITFSFQGFILGFLWGSLVRIFVVNQCIWALNSFCHVIGVQNFTTTEFDKSKNSFLLAFLTFGQGWHNNHHAFPRSAYTGLYWWQVDIGGFFVSIFKFLGLAHDVNIPSKQAISVKSIKNHQS